MNIHTHLKQYHDPNRAYNDLKNDEGYEPFLMESKTIKRTMTVKLQIKKLCEFCNNDNEPMYLGVKDQRENLSPEEQNIVRKNCGGVCNITKIQLFDRHEFDSKIFGKSLMIINYDHRRPKFKNGSESIENFQIISEFVNREKNKICKSCHNAQCEKCALAFPETCNVIFPTGQNISTLRSET